MVVLRARWLVPISEAPLRNGWCAIDRGRIAAIGRSGPGLPLRDDAPLIDLEEMAVVPALVNAHTHLEYAWLRGRVPRAEAFTDWVRDFLRARGTPPAREVSIGQAMDEAIEELIDAGTGAVGDIGNTLISVEPLCQSRLRGVVFHELLRLAAAEAESVLQEGLEAVSRYGDGRVRVSLAPHAPYSVSPRLFQGIRAALGRSPFAPTSVHLGESKEELELLATGKGPWRQLLEELGAWDADWTAPGCGPVAYLDRMGVLDSRTLVVHGVHLTAPELRVLADRGCTLVTCPRSNRFVGAGDPPVERFYDAGVLVALGTDSLASNEDLNLFAELAAVRRLAPGVPARRLLESATTIGAAALGLGAEMGAIEPGRAATLIAVEIPSGLVDVEEYLVSGVRPAQVHWVSDLLGEAGVAGRG